MAGSLVSVCATTNTASYGSLGSINKHRAKPINYSSDKWRMEIWD